MSLTFLCWKTRHESLNNKILFMIVSKCVCYLKRQNTTYEYYNCLHFMSVRNPLITFEFERNVRESKKFVRH